MKNSDTVNLPGSLTGFWEFSANGVDNTEWNLVIPEEAKNVFQGGR